MSIMRTVGMIALACTGIGAIYMLSKLQWVSPNCVGIVLNYETQQYEELEPGLHCILHPLRFYKEEVSKQTQVLALGSFSAKSLDNVDATLQADITFEITDPKKLYQKVKNPLYTLQETVKGAFSSAIQTLDFQDITSAEINSLAAKAGHSEKSEHERDDTTISASVSTSVSSRVSSVSLEEKLDDQASRTLQDEREHKAKMAAHGANFFGRLLALCGEWGISIRNFRVISVEAKHASISNALELTARSKVEAQAQLNAANSQARTIRILAEANRAAQLTRGQAANETAAALGKQEAGLTVYTQESFVRANEALGGNKGLLVNAPGISLGDRAFAAFSANNASQITTRDDSTLNRRQFRSS
ncbi:MAG: SPFH domain-containing protein [Pseudomonadota bacterium]